MLTGTLHPKLKKVHNLTSYR